MSNFIICEDNGIVIGTFADLASAQTEAQSLADAYAAGNADYSVQNTSTLYVCVFTRTINRDNSGIALTTTQQIFNKTWRITTLSVP